MSDECCVCMDNDADRTLPCDHKICTCCSYRMSKCPVCRNYYFTPYSLSFYDLDENPLDYNDLNIYSDDIKSFTHYNKQLTNILQLFPDGIPTDTAVSDVSLHCRTINNMLKRHIFFYCVRTDLEPERVVHARKLWYYGCPVYDRLSSYQHITTVKRQQVILMKKVVSIVRKVGMYYENKY
jgi:hypothetical protein